MSDYCYESNVSRGVVTDSQSDPPRPVCIQVAGSVLLAATVSLKMASGVSLLLSPQSQTSGMLQPTDFFRIILLLISVMSGESEATTCYCHGHCPNNALNGTCEAPAGAPCFAGKPDGNVRHDHLTSPLFQLSRRCWTLTRGCWCRSGLTGVCRRTRRG